MERIADASPLSKARVAGFFWLMTILTGAFAMFARGRLGLAVNLIATACYLAATVLVYGLLKPVNRSVSLLAAFFSLVGCALGASRSLFQLGARTSNIAFVFFGLHCLLVGYLILRSTFLPRAVGALMAFGGLGWLTLSVATFLSPPLASSLSPYILIPGILGEASLTLWLLVVGVNAQRWKEQASAGLAPAGRV
jgi:Domain of unknown function (DUF4386)